MSILIKLLLNENIIEWEEQKEKEKNQEKNQRVT